MTSFRLIAAIAFLFAAFIACSGPAWADYPSPVDDYVNDYAGVIGQPDVDVIRTMFKDLERKTGVEAVVVTIQSVEDYGTDKSIEEFATGLFNSWGVGHKKENNGVMMLVSVKDRECRIELGSGYGNKYDALMSQVIDDRILPHFKAGDYSRGIFEGSRGVIESVTKKVSWFQFYKWHILIGALIIICIFAGISCMKSGRTGWGWVFFSAAGLLLFFLIRMLNKGKSSDGFGGGKSSGGGASGKW